METGGVANAGGSLGSGAANAGGSSSAGGIGAGGRAVTNDDGTTSRDAGARCTPIVRPAPCNDSIACIDDLRPVASRFPTCSTGPVGLPYLERCGQYDAILEFGIDSGTTFFFDHADGHLVAVKYYGIGAPNCQSENGAFQSPQCDAPPQCRWEDAGGGISIEKCSPLESDDAGAPPAFCPMRASPPVVLGSTPTVHDEPDSVTVKFVEGSHVRLTDGEFGIDPLALLDEDPGLLRCVNLTVAAAVCDVHALDDDLFSRDWALSAARVFDDQSEAALDQQRAEGRADGGEYLDDLNLYYILRSTPENVSQLYDILARSPIVDTVYYNPIPSSP